MDVREDDGGGSTVCSCHRFAIAVDPFDRSEARDAAFGRLSYVVGEDEKVVSAFGVMRPEYAAFLGYAWAR